MRYLCTNRECNLFAKLIAGSRQNCEACGQRVLDEKVMLKHGRSIQSVIGGRSRAGSVSALLPQRMPPITEPPREEEDSQMRGRRDNELRQVLTAEKLAEELQDHTIGQVALKYRKPSTAIKALLREYNLSARELRKSARAKEPGHERKEATSVADALPVQGDRAGGAVTWPPVAQKIAEPAPELKTAKAAGDEPPIAPVPAPRRSGFQFQITRSVEAKPTVVGDVDALAAAVEHLQEGSRFNLTILLEEAS